MPLPNRVRIADFVSDKPPFRRRTPASCYFVALSAVFYTCVFLAAPREARARQAAGAAQEINWHAIGNTPCIWSPPVLSATGAIDAEATIQILKKNGMSCYGALIWSRNRAGVFSWASFKKFVEAAQPAGINVWAILIPPSEGGNSPPFNKDYVRWMQELARFSLRHPNLQGVNIDDYVSGISKKTFTPSYTCQIYRAKQAINPKLQFAPTIYDLDRSFAEEYGSCIDGAWLWFTNLDTPSGLQSWLEDARAAIGNRFPIYSGVYAHDTSWHSAPPKSAILRRSLEIACRYGNGAIIWQMPLTPPNPWLKTARDFGAGGSSPLAGKCGTFVGEESH